MAHSDSTLRCLTWEARACLRPRKSAQLSGRSSHRHQLSRRRRCTSIGPAPAEPQAQGGLTRGRSDDSLGPGNPSARKQERTVLTEADLYLDEQSIDSEELWLADTHKPAQRRVCVVARCAPYVPVHAQLTHTLEYNACVLHMIRRVVSPDMGVGPGCRNYYTSTRHCARPHTPTCQARLSSHGVLYLAYWHSVCHGGVPGASALCTTNMHRVSGAIKRGLGNRTHSICKCITHVL